jgi:hypothetical protein
MRLKRGRFEVDDIANPVDTQLEAVHGQASCDSNAIACFRLGVVSLFVQQATLGCESILDPQPFKVNQRRLPLAEQHVLQSGDGQ